MKKLNSNEYTAFIYQYGQDIFDHINDVIETQNYTRAFALLVYVVEMAEEVFYRHQNQITLIGTKVYGLTHNREVNSLDMNYLVEPDILTREVTYEEALSEVDKFIPKMAKGFHSRHISALPKIIRALRVLVAEGISEGYLSGEISSRDVVSYVDSHNRMVDAHLQYRLGLEELSISSYKDMSEIRESKMYAAVQRISEDARKVLAAFVYLSSTGEMYSGEDVSRLTGFSRYEVAEFLDYLCDMQFLSRKSGQKYYSTTILFGGMTPEEALTLLDSSEAVVESAHDTEVQVAQSLEEQEPFTWQEALLYTTLRRLSNDGTVQIAGNPLVLAAFRGRYAASGGVTTAALTSLESRGLISRDTSARPYTYQILQSFEVEEVYGNVASGEMPELLEVLKRNPIDVDVEAQQVEIPYTNHDSRSVDVLISYPQPSEENEVDTQQKAVSEANAQAEATRQLETVVDGFIIQRVSFLSSDVAQKVFEQGKVSMAYDEATGTTSITFSYVSDADS